MSTHILSFFCDSTNYGSLKPKVQTHWVESALLNTGARESSSWFPDPATVAASHKENSEIPGLGVESLQEVMQQQLLEISF